MGGNPATMIPYPRALGLVAVAAVAVLVLLAGPAAAGHGEATSDFAHCSNPSVTVELASTFLPFIPPAAVVDAGTCVAFENTDAFDHSLRVLSDTQGHVSETLDPHLAPGETTTVLFEETGVYHVNCGKHPLLMHGTVEVT